MSTSEAFWQEKTQERTPAPAGSMSRIFPAEEAEVVGTAPWMVEELYSPGQPMPVARAHTESPVARSMPQVDVEAKVAEVRAQAQREMDAAVQRARQECEAKAHALVQNEVEPWLKRMAQSIEDIGTVKQRYLAESEDQLVRLAVAVARRILYREIQVDTEALLGLVHAATQRSELRELNRILLNPKDHQALLPHLERLRLPPRVEVVSDSALERGALLLESTSGILDASIQAQLDEVERGFIDLLGRR